MLITPRGILLVFHMCMVTCYMPIFSDALFGLGTLSTIWAMHTMSTVHDVNSKILVLSMQLVKRYFDAIVGRTVFKS